MYKGKRVLVTGGAGMVGRQVVSQLQDFRAEVRVADKLLHKGTEFPRDAEVLLGDLTDWDFCVRAVKGVDYVFHLAAAKAGVGGSTGSLASVMFVPNILMDTNIMEAARLEGVERFLFTSSYSIHSVDTELHSEHEAWSGYLPPTDYYAWAKRMGEFQAKANAEQYGWDKIAIVRPAHMYGPWDNFDLATSQVIPALIRKAIDKVDPMVVWGSGKREVLRDFIFSADVARGMIMALEKYACCDPINLGTGIPVSIEDLVELVLEVTDRKPKVVWDNSKPTGRKIMVMDTRKAREKLGFAPSISLREGIRIAADWYISNRERFASVQK